MKIFYFIQLVFSWFKSFCTRHNWKVWSCKGKCAISKKSPFPAGWTSQMGQIAIVDTARLLTKDLTKTFACEVCGKVFKHPDSLRQHHKAHTGETKCPVCYMVMSRKYELRVHLRKRHNIIQWYNFAVFTGWPTREAPTGPYEISYTACAPVIILFTVIHRESKVFIPLR
jgi:hypothetical protein